MTRVEAPLPRLLVTSHVQLPTINLHHGALAFDFDRRPPASTQRSTSLIQPLIVFVDQALHSLGRDLPANKLPPEKAGFDPRSSNKKPDFWLSKIRLAI